MNKYFIFYVLIFLFSFNSNASLSIEASTLFFNNQDDIIDRLPSLSNEEKGNYLLQATRSLQQEIENLNADDHVALSRQITLNPRINYLDLLLSALELPESNPTINYISFCPKDYGFKNMNGISILDEISSHANKQLLRDELKLHEVIERIFALLSTKYIGKNKLSNFERKIFGVFLKIINHTASGRNQLVELLYDEQFRSTFFGFFDDKFKQIKSDFCDAQLIFTNFLICKASKNYNNLEKNYRDPELVPLSEFCGGILYNNDGYISEQTTPEENHAVSWQKGLPIEKNGIRTGYNIHFPKRLNQASRLIVLVYGGNECTYKTADFIPGVLNQTKKKLLAESMVVATLNLPDRLKLKVYQGEMNEPLYEEIHQAIHNFYTQITDIPEALLASNCDGMWQERVLFLKKIKKYLMGASFGGSVAVRHLQKYPKTFTGAISHDGALDSTKHKFSYLKPVDFIDCLQDDVLILQNLDDSRVGARQALNLYKQLKKRENSFLHITPRGSAARFHYVPSNDCLFDISTKGHFEVSDKYYSDAYCEAIMNFMSEDNNRLNQLKNKSESQFKFYDKLYNILATKKASSEEVRDHNSYKILIKLRDNNEHAKEYFRLAKNYSNEQYFTFIKHFINETDMRKVVQEAMFKEEFRFEWRIINDFFFRDLPQKAKIHIKESLFSWITAKSADSEKWIDFIENALKITSSASEYEKYCAQNQWKKIDLWSIVEKIYMKVRQLPEGVIPELSSAQEEEFRIVMDDIHNGLL